MPEKPNRRDTPESEPKWSFDHQGDYAVDRKQRAERIAALVVAAVWVALVFHQSGLGQALRMSALFGVGVAAIWWPEALSQWRSERPSLRAMDWDGISNPRRSVGATRIAGWMILTLPVIVWGVSKLVKAG